MAKPKTVKVYLTDEEKQTVLDRAGALSLSEYLRRAGLGKRSLTPPAPAINRQTYLALADIGRSLQQIEIALNQSPEQAPNLSAIEALAQQIEQVRWQLIAPNAEAP